MEQFLAERRQKIFNSLTSEEKLKLIQQFPLEQRLNGIPPEQLLSAIPLKDLDAQALEKLLQVIQARLNNTH